MNLDNIEAFLYAFQLGSFNKAAEALYLTQPSITARIQSLERELEGPLFHRDGKQIALTERGKQFLPYAQKILHAYQEISSTLREKPLAEKSLTIGCTLLMSTHILPEILPIYRRKYPGVNIRILVGSSDYIMDKVLKKEADFGLVRTVSHPLIESFHLHTDTLHLVVPPHHPFREITPSKLTWDKVGKEPHILLAHGTIEWLLVQRHYHRNQINPHIMMEVDNFEAAKKMVMRGVGISFLPELCIAEELSNNLLYEISPQPSAQLTRKIDIIFLRDGNRDLVEFFIHAVKALERKTLLAKTF
ncbi:LysR family transcriptional regulator [Brevibacillus centrosporus]|uniref:LysR family transcriptional regulator n=1 Tax=Brevibacillus centrosporus TaxID=54910 RepID=UPI00380EA8B3